MSNKESLYALSALALVTYYCLRLRRSKRNYVALIENDVPLTQELLYTNATAYEAHVTEQLQLHSSVASIDSYYLIIGVCGGSGSGKTTLSQAIIRDYGVDNVTYISHDYYYKDLSHLAMEERAKQNFDHPNALETSLLLEHLKLLKSGKDVEIPVYDFATHSRKCETRCVSPKRIILLEGILIFAEPKLLPLMDIKVFVETAADIRLLRRLKRDMEERHRTAEEVMTQYLRNVRPMHMMFVESSKQFADIIVPHGVNSVALDMIISKLHRFTAQAL